ncbi:MAG: NAD-dependent epimerase/dehydratase family protein [Chitinophagaceae bacterium]
MKILVTGATGFIGTHLLEQLVSKNVSIKAIFHKSEPHLSTAIIKQIEWIKADLTNLSALKDSFDDIDQIFHCVGTPHGSACQENLKNLFNGTKNIVNLAITHNIKKILYVSNTSTLKTINEKGLLQEQLPNSFFPQWHDKEEILYFEIEKEIWRGMAEGLSSIIINPTHILGPHNWKNVNNNLFTHIYQNSFLESCPIGCNGFVTLQNVVEAMILLMQSNVCNERFIISAENRSYKDIFLLISKGFNKPLGNKPPNSYKINQIIIRNSISHFFNNDKNTLNKKEIMTMNKSYQYDNSKFLKYFKNFEYQSITANIIKLCESYKQKFKLR